MKRRLLLSGLIGLAAAPFTPRALADMTVKPASRRLRLQESPVDGFQYHQGEAAWPQLRLGMPLQLRREPGNPYDPRAIEIRAGTYKLGYVPRLDNCAASQLLDAGHRLCAQVVALQVSVVPWQRVLFRIDLEG